MTNFSFLRKIDEDSIAVDVIRDGYRTIDSTKAAQYLCEDGHYISWCMVSDEGKECTLVLKELGRYEDSTLDFMEYEKMKRVREPGEVERLIAANYISNKLPLPEWLAKHEGMNEKKVRNEEFGIYTIFEWIEKEKAEGQAHS